MNFGWMNFGLCGVVVEWFRVLHNIADADDADSYVIDPDFTIVHRESELTEIPEEIKADMLICFVHYKGLYESA